MNEIKIKEVKSKSDLNKFISFPDKLYRGNKFRVPQLHRYEKASLVREKNPAFDFCKAKYWLAFKDGEIVGRIAGILNERSNEIWKEKYLRFGWIDFIDDYEVSSALIKTVEDWAKHLGMKTVHGPLGFSDMDLEGMLIEGFDEIGTQATIYNYPYYPKHIEKLAYVKDVDWTQNETKVPKEVPERVKRISSLALKKYDLKILDAKKAKDIVPYANSMFNTLNEAFEHLYGFVPLNDKQIKQYTKDYIAAIDPKYVCFVLDKNNEVVGFGISILSLSKALQKAKGKLFPFGFIHILKALKKNDTVDMLLQGVKPDYINKGVAAIFFNKLIQAYIDNNVKVAISSHALETNKSAIQIFDAYDTRVHLRRRVYKKALLK